MPDDGFLETLTQRLQDFGAETGANALPSLKSELTNFSKTYKGLLEVLKRKGLLAEDPYQYTEKISEIKPVSADPFIESQRQTVVSIRLHNFESQLAYLAEFYQFSFEFLTLARLRAIAQLLRFVRWDGLSETHSEINTRAVSELVGKVRKSEDTISAGLVNDMLGQLNGQLGKILDALKKVTLYKREEYKLLLRTTFWGNLSAGVDEFRSNSEKLQRSIKKEFAEHLKGQPYIPELVKELIDEDYNPGFEGVREELLIKLAVKKAVVAPPKAKEDVPNDLMEGVRTLGSLSLPLDAALRKVQENAVLMVEPDDSLGARFQRWLHRLMGGQPKPRYFSIDLFDPATGATRREDLNFDAFVVDAAGRSRVLAAYAVRTSTQFTGLQQKEEPEIMSWFERYFIEAGKTVERLNGLDLFFKTEVPKEKRSQVKGIKAEVSQIRTIMNNANKARHEAVARREEDAQLRRLGIKS